MKKSYVMKLQAPELPIGIIKPQARRKTSKLAPLIALTILLTIPLYYPSIRESSKKLVFPEEPDIYVFKSFDDDSTESELPLEPPNPVNEDDIDIHKSPPCSIKQNDQCSEIIDVRKDGEVPVVVRNQHRSSSSRKRHEKGRRKRSRCPANPGNENTWSRKKTEKFEKISSASSDRASMLRLKLLDEDKCDIFSGEWVPDQYGPYYTNDTCYAIQEHQNCMKFQRPDLEFLKWRWKPDDCELPLFDPNEFLELVRGKSMAFVGDSVARNHMQSLVCLLSRVTYPVDLSDPIDQNRRYEYREYDFNISMFWSPYLIRTEKFDPNNDKRPFKLFLDEFDPHWTTQVTKFDYVIISAGHWFFRPTYFYVNKSLTGCLYCPEPEIPHLTSYFSYRRAFRTSLRALASIDDFNGVVFLRTFAPSHFEGGQWDKGGDCVRTRPFTRNQTSLKDYSLEMYLIQLEELGIARRVNINNNDNGGRFEFKLFDATKAMLLRPDGHPSKYGHWQVPNQTFSNDCVHWCLPGPIDSWNDLLQELLKRER